MKKIVCIGVAVFLATALIFAETNSKTKGGNGNGGKDKIGGWLGVPFIGVSYSHEFNDLVELDALVAYNGLGYGGYKWRSINVQCGALFTVWDPVIEGLGNQHCPLSVGPVLGGSLNFVKYSYVTYKETPGTSMYGMSIPGTRIPETKTETLKSSSFYLLAVVRWELNFGNIPNLNLFIDAAPIGFGRTSIPSYDTAAALKGEGVKLTTIPLWHYTGRVGIGARYRIPSKK